MVERSFQPLDRQDLTAANTMVVTLSIQKGGSHPCPLNSAPPLWHMFWVNTLLLSLYQSAKIEIGVSYK